MAIEAPVSKYRKTNLKIYIVVCLGLTIWCIYDAHFNKKFIEKYTDANGNPTGWLVVNRKAPPFLIGAAVLFGAYLFYLKDKKLIADEDGLLLTNNARIPYETIERIDKTYFDSKGYFILTYKDQNGRETNRRISTRQYDNLPAVLDHLTAKIWR